MRLGDLVAVGVAPPDAFHHGSVGGGIARVRLIGRPLPVRGKIRRLQYHLLKLRKRGRRRRGRRRCCAAVRRGGSLGRRTTTSGYGNDAPNSTHAKKTLSPLHPTRRTLLLRRRRRDRHGFPSPVRRPRLTALLRSQVHPAP